jgi:replicative DNA helicase
VADASYMESRSSALLFGVDPPSSSLAVSGGQCESERYGLGSLAVETSLIGALLLNPEAVLRIGKLQAEDFFSTKHQSVFRAALAVCDRGDPLDTITLEAELTKQGRLQAIGGLAGLNEYMLAAGTADNASYYASIIRDHSFARRLKLATSGATTRLTSGADWHDELAMLAKALEELQEAAHQDPPTLLEAVTGELGSIERGEASSVGLPSGLGLERASPTGIPVGYVTTLFGESGGFKSTITNNLIWNIAAAGHGVLHVSWEDSAQLTAQRFIAKQTGVGYGKLAARQFDGDERSRMTVGDDARAAASRIIMASETEANMDAVIRAARYYKRTRGIKLVVVDYIQSMEFDERRKQHEQIGAAVKKARQSAAKDELAYLLVSQVDTNLGERDDPRPKMEDCFGSGQIRMFTKLGVSVFRPSKYCKVPSTKGAYAGYGNLAASWPEGRETFLREVYPNVVELTLDKNVMGASPTVIHVLVDPPTGKLSMFDPKGML